MRFRNGPITEVTAKMIWSFGALIILTLFVFTQGDSCGNILDAVGRWFGAVD